MLFKPEFIPLLESGRKTQTRRLIRREDRFTCATFGEPAVYRNGRLLWAEGHDYAVQPGRGKKSVGRVRVTSIRSEALQDIIAEDVEQEGIFVFDSTAGGMYSPPNYADIHRDIFIGVWDSLNAKRGFPFDSNPWVWVLGLEWVGESEVVG